MVDFQIWDLSLECTFADEFANFYLIQSTLTYSPLKFDGHLVPHSHEESQDEADGTRTTADREENVW